MHRPFQFRVRALLLITAVVGCNTAVFRFGVLPFYLVSIFSVSLLTCYYFRFARYRSQVTAGLWGVKAGMAWTAGTYAAVVFINTGSLLAAAIGCLIGGGLGFLVGLAPVLLLALIPEPQRHYYGRRNSEDGHDEDRVVSSIIPYIGGSGG